MGGPEIRTALRTLRSLAVRGHARVGKVEPVLIVALALAGGLALLAPGSATTTTLSRLATVTPATLRLLAAADAYWGSESYSVDWASRAVLTFAGAATGSIDVPLTQPEIDAHVRKGATGTLVVADGMELVVVVWHSEGPSTEPRSPCPAVVQQPRAWRILVARLDANGRPGSFAAFAAGKNTIVFGGPMGGEGCQATSIPSVSVSDGLIAYSLDDSTPQRPYGSRILIRALTDGTTLRDLATPTHVLSLELSGTTIAWLEADGDNPTSLPLRLSTAAQPAAQDMEVLSTPGGQMSWSLPSFSLAGNSLAWERYGTGQVWMRDLIGGDEQQVSPSGLVCMLGGIAPRTVAMNCGDDASGLQQNLADAPSLVVWSVGVGLRLVVGIPPVLTEKLSNGWIAVVPKDRGSVQAFPLDSLTKH